MYELSYAYTRYNSNRDKRFRKSREREKKKKKRKERWYQKEWASNSPRDVQGRFSIRCFMIMRDHKTLLYPIEAEKDDGCVRRASSRAGGRYEFQISPRRCHFCRNFVDLISYPIRLHRNLVELRSRGKSCLLATKAYARMHMCSLPAHACMHITLGFMPDSRSPRVVTSRFFLR